MLAQELNSTGAVIEAVRTTPGAIGYASLSSVEDQEGITVLTVGGVAPSEETVLDGSYAIQRPFVFATRTDEALSDAAGRSHAGCGRRGSPRRSCHHPL